MHPTGVRCWVHFVVKHASALNAVWVHGVFPILQSSPGNAPLTPSTDLDSIFIFNIVLRWLERLPLLLYAFSIHGGYRQACKKVLALEYCHGYCTFSTDMTLSCFLINASLDTESSVAQCMVLTCSPSSKPAASPTFLRRVSNQAHAWFSPFKAPLINLESRIN